MPHIQFPYIRLSCGTNPKTQQQWALDYTVLVVASTGEHVILLVPSVGPLDDVGLRPRPKGWLLRRDELQEMLKSLDAPPACTCDEEDDANEDA